MKERKTNKSQQKKCELNSQTSDFSTACMKENCFIKINNSITAKLMKNYYRFIYFYYSISFAL